MRYPPLRNWQSYLLLGERGKCPFRNRGYALTNGCFRAFAFPCTMTEKGSRPAIGDTVSVNGSLMRLPQKVKSMGRLQVALSQP